MYGKTALIVFFLLAAGCSSSSSSTDDAGTGSDSSTTTDGAGDDTSVATDGTTTDGTATDGTADGGTSRTLTFTNRCKATIWVGLLNNPESTLPEGGGFELDPGMRHDVVVPGKWAGRAWGRTGCVVDGADKITCETGDCGGKGMCAGTGGKPPASLAEFTFSGFGGMDFYDVSLVDGYNLPIAIAPKLGTYTTTTGGTYDCGVPSCTSDLNLTCPTELQVTNAGGTVVACQSACEKFASDQYCCKGSFGTPATCPPTDYSKTFKTACPGAYSYAYDDKTSTFTCKGRDYDIAFCP